MTSSTSALGASVPADPRADELSRLRGLELRKHDLGEVRLTGQAEAAARLGRRTIRQHHEDTQKGSRRGTSTLEQVSRERVDPVAVLEHEHERLLGRAGAQAVGEERLERRLAELGLERARQLVVRDRDPEQDVEQRRSRDERLVDVGELALEGRHLRVRRVVVVETQEAPPDLPPDAVARVRPERLALAERDDVPAPPRPPHELGDET